MTHETFVIIAKTFGLFYLITLIAAQARAVHKDIATKAAFDAAKDAADRGVVNTPGILRPQYLISLQDSLPIVPSSPEFIREDVSSR